MPRDAAHWPVPDPDTFISERANGEAAASELRTARAVRARCAQLLRRARLGGSSWFRIDDAALEGTAQAIARSVQTGRRRPRQPLHSRWRDFEAGGIDRLGLLERRLSPSVPGAQAHARIDVTVVSVLLDPHAGTDSRWAYTEPATGLRLPGSPGLGVASFHAFLAGLFSSDPQRPLQADARGLRGLLTDRLAQALQVSPANPLEGLEERAILLRRLGETLSEQPEVFGEEGRPAGLFDIIISPFGHGVAHTADVDAHYILSQLLATLCSLGPAHNQIGGVPLGDCWRHDAVRADGSTDGWLPLHTSAQWIAASLLEPFLAAGVRVRGAERLTALADRPTCGLFLDTGVLQLRDPDLTGSTWQPADELIVEWRALSVALMDAIAPRVQALLGLDPGQLRRGGILEGGARAAGRDLAQRLRAGFAPLQVARSSTVF